MKNTKPIIAGFIVGLMLAFSPACGPAKRCTPASCNGCCDANGDCQAGAATNACGRNGDACIRCSLGETCGAGNCLTGQVNGNDGGETVDSGTIDAGELDAGIDSGVPDAGAVDSGIDAGPTWFHDGGAAFDAGTFTWASTLDDYPSVRVPGEWLSGICPAGSMREVRDVFGTDLYTTDSSLCTAGVHAGVMQFNAAHAITVELRPNASSFAESFQNDVGSNAYQGDFRTFVFVK